MIVALVPAVFRASFIAGTNIVFLIFRTAGGRSSARLYRLPFRLYLCRQTSSRSSRQVKRAMGFVWAFHLFV